MQRTIIVGGGHGAAEVAIALRQKGWQGEIVMFSDEPYLPYQRPPLSKAYLNGDVTEEHLLIKKAALYEKAQVTCHLNTRVESIDRENKCVQLKDGSTLAYDFLVLATGARARTLSFPGSHDARVNYLRTLDDVASIRQWLADGKQLLIVGAGYIGLELAASARKMGVNVTVLELMDRVLARVTCPQMSQFFQNLHLSHGVDLRLQTGLKSLTEVSGGIEAELSDDTSLKVDCVVIGAGVIPNVELAEAAGLACDNGIVVDQYCRTDDASIFAIGDVANHPNAFYGRRLRLESVPNALDQAKVAAAAIVDQPVSYDALPWFWSDQYDVKLQTAGLAEGFDDVVVRGNVNEQQFSLFYLQEGRLIALDAINSPVDFMQAKRFIPQRLMLTRDVILNSDQWWAN